MIEQAVHILRQARYGIALTGAGVSTPSGIPDFRSPDSGVWRHHDPFEVASIYAFRQHPERFFEWIRPLAAQLHDAQPNAAHVALAQLEHDDVLHMIITQNIDGLHQRAGAAQVAEVHGHVREATCMRCYHVVKADQFMHDFIATGNIPRCSSCAGILKPNVILFGEALPARALLSANQAVQRCDVLLIAGSSLEVAPVSELPQQAHRNGAKVIIVNYTSTYMDSAADVVIHGDVAEVLPQIAAGLKVASWPAAH
jgi:NAD-dependent deacetylase